MPFNWNPQTERAMLLIACADSKPGAATWQTVADRLGGGLNANAVSQKFYKLKKESEKLINGDVPSTPATKKNTKASGSTTTTGKNRKRKMTDEDEATPSKPTKKQAAATHALAMLDDGEIKTDPDAKMKKERNCNNLHPVIATAELVDLEMEDDGRKAEDA